MADIAPSASPPVNEDLAGPAIAEPGVLAHAIFVARDGRTVTLYLKPDGLLLDIERRRENGPLEFDRWQAMAFRSAVSAIPEP